MISFPTMTVEEKMEAAEKFSLDWPCIICPQDFVSPRCPEGWRETSKGVCTADLKLVTLASRCPMVIDFQHMVPELRRITAMSCNHQCMSESRYSFRALWGWQVRALAYAPLSKALHARRAQNPPARVRTC